MVCLCACRAGLVDSMIDEIKNTTIVELFSKLHRAISELISDASKMVELNDSVKMDSVRNIRNDIVKKLNGNENIEENKTLVKILDLFITDKSFIRMIRDDSKEWLEFLDVIERNMNKIGNDLSGEDRKEIANITKAIDDARKMIRK